MLTKILQGSRTILSDVEISSLRIRIFVPVFAIACVASLAYDFSRPAVYVSSARLQVEVPPGSGRLKVEVPPGRGRAKGEVRPGQRQVDKGESSTALLTEAQALTSGAVLEQVLQQVTRSSPEAAGAIGSVEALQRMLSVAPVSGTNVIELLGEGSNRELLPRIVKAWIEVYQQAHLSAHGQSSEAALVELQSADKQLRQKLADKRRELEQFRRKHDIISLEREENQVMARLKGLNTALSDARTREVNAEARLNAMREAVAAGRTLDRPADRAIIADLEKRAIDLREKMKDLEQDYTPQYLALDGKYKALRANLARLEQQIEREKQASSKQGLQAAEEELTSAQQTVLRLLKELAVRKQEIQNFSTRFAEHTALANELRGLEEMNESGKQRLAQLEIEVKGAGPKVAVLSPPSVPDRPERPEYWRDAVIAVVASAVLGLLAVWFVEFFKRSGVPRPEMVAQPIIHIGYAPGGMVDVTPAALGSPPPLQLPASVARLPRELSSPEVRALWDAGSPDARLVVAGLLGGLAIEELGGLRYEDIDFDGGRIETRGTALRSLVLREPLRQLLKERQAAHGGGATLADAQGSTLSTADLEGLIACAACDAGLAYPTEVNSEVLRHTYLAYLVRQGAKLADIGGMIGRIAPAMVREYGRLSPPGPGLPLDQIDPIFPALK